MAKKVKEEKRPNEIHYCKECEHCTYVTEPFKLLSLKGEPTLGDCPYRNRRVLLTERSCVNFKPRRKHI